MDPGTKFNLLQVIWEMIEPIIVVAVVTIYGGIRVIRQKSKDAELRMYATLEAAKLKAGIQERESGREGERGNNSTWTGQLAGPGRGVGYGWLGIYGIKQPLPGHPWLTQELR
jgi:hypothetical protein